MRWPISCLYSDVRSDWVCGKREIQQSKFAGYQQKGNIQIPVDKVHTILVPVLRGMHQQQHVLTDGDKTSPNLRPIQDPPIANPRRGVVPRRRWFFSSTISPSG